MGPHLVIRYLVGAVYAMARPLRIEFPGALYHVTSRGNARLSRLATAGFRDKSS